MWVPGEPVITLRHHEELRPQLAYDAESGTPVEAPPQSGKLRSTTGLYRTEWVSGPAIALLSPAGEERVVAVHESGDEGNSETGLVDPDPYETVAFSADESRMFVARGAQVYVMDPADGRILEVIENDEIEIHSLRVSPSGDYLAISGESPGKLEVIIQRVSDHQVVTRHAIGRGWYPLQTYEMAWSPNGRWLAANLTLVKVNSDWEPKGGETHIFRVGLPTEPAVPVPGRGGRTERAPEASDVGSDTR
jgi:dipeptidyl aminopeptidase/acylaminoacyl peptidase